MSRSVKSTRRENRPRKTVKVLVPRSENTRAQRIYLIAVGFMIWVSLIRMAIIIKLIMIHGQLDPAAAILETIIFFCFTVGILGIVKIKPPLHYLIPVGAIVNIIPSYSDGNSGYPFLLLSFLILYIAIRFPIHFQWEKRTLEK